MPTLELTDEVRAVIKAQARNAAKPTTLVAELLEDARYSDTCSPVHIEAAELVRHVNETSEGPGDDLGGYLADALNDMPLKDRPLLNALTAKMLLGTISVDEQSRLNEIHRKAILAHGAIQVDSAMQRQSVAYAIARKAGAL